MEEICIHALLRFVAAQVHLVVDLLLHTHYVVRSSFLAYAIGGTHAARPALALRTPAIMPPNNPLHRATSVRAAEQQFPELCLRRAVQQRLQPDKGDEVEAFKNTGRHASAVTATRLTRGDSRVAVRLMTTPKRVEDGLVDFERLG